MKTLVIIPLQVELDCFVQSCTRRGFAAVNAGIGLLAVVHFPALKMTLATGGLGKAQFAAQTQHLLDAGIEWDIVLCAGAAGGLRDTISVGDVVVATSTVEHDFKNRFGSPILPHFDGPPAAIDDLKRAASQVKGFQVHFATIASGDEDVVDAERRGILEKSMGAVAVAWEGAGGARACAFSGVPFVEIRGITDAANHTASSDFESNLEFAMDSIATLITHWLTRSRA